MCPKTTSWERHLRRRDVIRLRYGQQLTISEISEELGFSESTIERDLQRIQEQVATVGRDESIRDLVLASLQHLLDHEFEDLHRADTQDDFRNKHDAKASFRKTLQMVRDLQTSVEETGEEPTPGEELITELPAEAQQVIADAAEKEVDSILGNASAGPSWASERH